MVPSNQNLRHGDDGGGAAADLLLPDDVLSDIFSRTTTLADVARCAATCRRWARVVAAHADAIVRALPPHGQFLPHLALGFLFLHKQQQEKGMSFVPSSPKSFPSSDSAHYLVDQHGGSHRPVTSRNGRVVLQLNRRRHGVLSLSVWNPMTGHVSTLPPLADFHGDYACAILTAADNDDLDGVVASPPGSFRVLVVYNRRGFTALRSYSSDTGRWGPEVRKPGAKIRGRLLRNLGHAVVFRGVAYWPLYHAAFGVRFLSPLLLLDGGGDSNNSCTASSDGDDDDVCFLLPYRMARAEAGYRALGVSPDGKALCYIGVGFVARTLLCVCVLPSQVLGPDYKNTTPGDGFWDSAIGDHHISVPRVRITRTSVLKLRWFGEKSGTLIFTVADHDEAGAMGVTVFAFNLATRSLEKLAEGHGCFHPYSYLYGYEMDYAALLASVASPPPLASHAS
ncbi:hypothetical protein QOZ80_5BG0428940 [Eleusine coracana subsp. coracana]|nr:hypothetical protein QOZ80_5BG0428940 [Eleusine coracana subsp. coracana]